MIRNKTSPHVQIFMKLAVNLPLSKAVWSCAAIERGQKHAVMLKVLNVMHPSGTTVMKSLHVWLSITEPSASTVNKLNDFTKIY